MEFEWDPDKDAETQRERGIGFEFAARIFSGPLIEWEDTRFDYDEVRMRAIGETAGHVLHVAYTKRGDVIRIISVRRANRKERERWKGLFE